MWYDIIDKKAFPIFFLCFEPPLLVYPYIATIVFVESSIITPLKQLISIGSCAGIYIEFIISALLLLVLLLLLSTLNQLARPDDFRSRGRIRNQRLGDEHANVILIGLVLWIFTGRDILCQVSGALEEQNQEDGADTSPAVWGVGGEAAPLVEHEPNGLFSEKVRVSAISPEARCDEAPI